MTDMTSYWFSTCTGKIKDKRETGFYVFDHHSLKALHNNWSEGHRSTIYQAACKYLLMENGKEMITDD